MMILVEILESNLQNWEVFASHNGHPALAIHDAWTR
jgi:hypothetical protein